VTTDSLKALIGRATGVTPTDAITTRDLQAVQAMIQSAPASDAELTALKNGTGLDIIGKLDFFLRQARGDSGSMTSAELNRIATGLDTHTAITLDESLKAGDILQAAPPAPTPIPPPAPTPIPPPAFDPNFIPGSLTVTDIPVDANGNVSSAALQAILKPKDVVDTNLLDNTHQSGLSDFSRQGIRMLAHDLYDGQINGDVALRSLFNPAGSGNNPFVKDPHALDITKEWGRRDLADDGTMNGSVLRKLAEDVWLTTDGIAIPGALSNGPLHNANLNASELFKSVTPLSSPQGVAEFTQRSGVSATDLLNFSLWGHRIMDKNSTTQGIATAALNDPASIDFGLAHLNSETLAFTQALTTDPNAQRTVGGAVINLLQRV
jgi:hypothetical protein